MSLVNMAIRDAYYVKGCLNKGLCQEQHIQESSQGLFADFVMHTYSLLSKLLVSKAI